MPPALYDIAVANFAIATTEFAVLRDPGLLATLYASIAMAAIVLLIALCALDQQPTIGNAKASWLAPS
ncbi:hypothetical protein CDS [Bradyrhizobium sp.]|uniref:hypothetical protein n=1 Tax=Bradyrhizobium sp. TaxID=376 RepID=UPI0007C1C1FE|nr:hypothetical protein [Bradyrhizobium sp.]CUU17709.1 hypothetical protein CDS [Bradyrhizobium sp.]